MSLPDLLVPTRRHARATTAAVAVFCGAAASMDQAVARAAPGPALTISGADKGRHPISDDIFGMNLTDPGRWTQDLALAKELALPVNRWGGNQATRYNFKLNATNSGSDWFFLSHVKQRSADEFVDRNEQSQTKTLMTVPTIGRVTRTVDAEHRCGFSIRKYGPQKTGPGAPADCGGGVRPDGTLLRGNDPADTSVPAGPDFTAEWVRHLTATHGDAAHDGVKVYGLDNEPALWSETHRDIHPDALTYDELWNRTREHAQAVKAADPTALTLGPSDWGWCAYFFAPVDDPRHRCGPGPDRAAHGDLDLAAFYLQQARAYEREKGVRLLDYFDEHYYPTKVALTDAGDAARQALRLRSTRSLWDKTYADEGWIGKPVALLPRMRDWIAKHYPKTKLAITEYNFGGLESINGALAQADVLGIFARERVDLATLWAAPRADQPGMFAFRMYRNYDGRGGRFGQTSLASTSQDRAKVSLHAAARRDGALTAIAVNKTGEELASPLSMTGVRGNPDRTVQVWRYSPAALGRIVREPDLQVKGSSTSLKLPPNSITTLVIQPGA